MTHDIYIRRNLKLLKSSSSTLAVWDLANGFRQS